MTESNVEIYRAAIDRFNRGDLDGYLHLYSDDVVFGGVSQEPMDKAGVRAFHEQFVAAFPAAQVRIADLVESGDKPAARLEFALDHQGEFMGVPATGNDAHFAMTTILTMRDGKCVERWTTADMLGLLIQLGAVPAPA
jgi:predicted ester cyclase